LKTGGYIEDKHATKMLRQTKRYGVTQHVAAVTS